MKRSRLHLPLDHDRDPPRWGQTRGGGASKGGKSIGSDICALPAPVELDDLRLAQIRQTITHSGANRNRSATPVAWSWIRTTAFALGFLVLGGVATAVAGRLYIRRIASAREASVAASSNRGSTEIPSRNKTRRWRMAVREPADLELSFDTTGARIAVMDGRAEITGPQLASPILLTPGSSWREGATAPEPPSRDPAHAPDGQTEPVASVVVPVRRSRIPAAPSARGPLAIETSPASTAPAPPSTVPPSSVPPLSDVEPPMFPGPAVPSSGRPQTSMAISPPRVTPTPIVLPDAPSEAFLVAGALRSLRVDGSAFAALAKLDEHRRRFPTGVLRREAALTRVEALLALGRNAAALDILDSLTLKSTGTERKITLARAELRADRGRCSQAFDDLNHLLADTPDDDIAARALYGRARCEISSRNLTRARGDLKDYVLRFPGGSHAAEVETLLRRIGG